MHTNAVAWGIVIGLVCAVVTAGAAQDTTTGALSFEALVAQVRRPPAGPRILRVRLRHAAGLQIGEVRTEAGRVVRHRRPELSVHDWVVVLEDAANRALDWQIVGAPEVARVWQVGSDGRARHSEIPTTPAGVDLRFAAVNGAIGIRVLRAEWSGTEFLLVPMRWIPLFPNQ